MASLCLNLLQASPMQKISVPPLSEVTKTGFTDLAALFDHYSKQVPVTLQSGDVMANFVSGIIMLTVAAAFYRYYYKQWPTVDEKSKGMVLEEWTSGPFDCTTDLTTCFWACCCTPVRWADTVSMAGLLQFWWAFAIFTLLLLFPLPIPVIHLLPFIVATFYRQKLRELFKMQGYGEAQTVCGDCVLMTCCLPCAVAQEARHIDAAAKAGHEALQEQVPIAKEVQERMANE
jgi:Cys-rich protein (TIGR01571 family)